MTLHDVQIKFEELLKLPAETEWAEFKEAKTTFDSDTLGTYFSALSNEANLKGVGSGWLVFGVSDRPPRRVVGTQYKRDRPSLDALKLQIANHTGTRLTFEEIYELVRPEGRVLLFRIPAAIRGLPTSWKGHYYGREGESIGALNPQEYELIRSQVAKEDWSARIIDGATISDLDPAAIAFARLQYRQKHPKQIHDLDGWDDQTFLNKAKVLVGGKLTRTALLLLGKAESAQLLSPAHARITWVLRDGKKQEMDYHHFDPPFLMVGEHLLQKIRNLTVRHLPSGTLFPQEVTQYDPWVIRETLHNCIAHQDYTMGGRINVVETPDTLLFTNLGSFIPGTVEEMIRSDAPPEVYRNPFLAQAMVNLNMIDTIGSGIKRMFTRQRERSFPMPDYDLSDPKKVGVLLTGQVLDENYTRLLLSQIELDLTDVIALDKVQKKHPLDEEAFRRLKARNLIEGRRPNVFVSAKIAAATGDKATYIKNRAFDKQHYKDLVVKYLNQYGHATRAELNELLVGKLSDVLETNQKKRFIGNMLQEMKDNGQIVPEGATRWAKWRLSKPAPEGGAFR